jgi:hypothetical protein
MFALRFIPVLLVLFVLPSLAQAESKRDLSYSFGTIWSAAVRYIRVDKRFVLGDKDKETGYMLFTYPGRGAVKACPGALELVKRTDEDGYAKVRVQLRIGHQPAYVELHFLDGLIRKLSKEQGPPPPPRKVTPPKDGTPKPKPIDKKPAK